MKIALLQMDIVWGKPEQNLANAEKLMTQHLGADIYVLPEMFSTGFIVTDDVPFELEEGDALRWMKRKAAELDAAVAGSVAVTDGVRHFNRFYFVHPDGEVNSYDKRHLFAFGGENKRFTRGEDRVVVRFRGFRFLLEVCYDLRFPVWSRNRGDYDCIIYVANWPTQRIGAWNTLLRARAIENQCFVVGVNRVGNGGGNEYCGGSVAIDAGGEVLTECREATEDVAEAVLDMTELENLRHRFPVLRDGDVFIL